MPYLETDAARLYYEDAGAGMPTVFMHPAAGSSASWEYQLPAFIGAGYRCVTFDARGFGKSEPSDSGQMGHASDDALALVDALALDRFALVAAAYGGFGGLDFALRFPERLLAFVLATSQGGITDAGFVATRQRIAGPEVRGMPIQFRELGPSYRVESPDGVERWLQLVHEANGEAAKRQETFSQTTLAMLESLTVPTLIVAADADLLAPPALMRLMADRIPGREFVTIADAGHSAHWERPEEWNAAVLRFLEKHRS
jgi:pimeloyl-ACP methyl ester carboxylesterase